MELVARYAIAIGVTGVVMTWLGPAGSSELMTPENRAIFWMIAVAFGWLQMMIIARGLRSVFGPDRFPGWVLLLMTAAIGAVPLTFEVRALWAQLRDGPGYVAPLYAAYFTTFLVNLMFLLILWSFVERWPVLSAVNGGGGDAAHPEPGADGTARVGLLRRRPDGLSGPILCLASEDHYVRVFTAGGNDLVLCRLSDAVADLEGTDGMQVHRSWWVARDAVEGVQNKNGRREFVLNGGPNVPIGRSYAAVLRDAGWL